jgi:hypothetical protein
MPSYAGEVVRVIEKGTVFRITKVIEKRGMADAYGIVFLYELEDEKLLFEIKAGKSLGELGFEYQEASHLGGNWVAYRSSETPPWKLVGETAP